MRALTHRRTNRLFALFLGGCWWLAPQFANCQEPNVANVESESIPTSRVPLPEATGIAEQKPTTVPYSNPGVLKTSWKIESRNSALGSQKPIQTTSVLLGWKSTPLGGALQRDSQIVDNDSETREAAVRKPAVSSMANPTEIVTVNWKLKSNSEANNSSLAQTQGNECPVAEWASDRFPAAQENSEVSSTTTDALNEVARKERMGAEAELASVVSLSASRIDLQTYEELQSLLEIPKNQPEFTYLTELNELLQAESNWIFANGDVLDLAPDEGPTTAAVSYLDDLNSLVEGRGYSNRAAREYRNAVVYQSDVNSTQNAAQRTPRNPYTSIAPDPQCHGIEGAGVSSIFKPISSVQLNGLSTDPPSRSRNDLALTAELPRPENKACQFMDSAAPIYYATPVRFGAHRPSRNTHVFWHQPLYFEDPNLERCGQTHGCLTTAASTVHFVTGIAFTPYLVGATHPAKCVQSLPDCRTCESFDCRAYWPGWSFKGAVAQAAVVTGFYFAMVP